MDVKELIQLDSHKVRGNSSLMAVYIEAFKNQFGYAPNCAGCTFGNDFAKLIRAVSENKSPTTTRKMEKNNTFVMKIQGKILAYRKDGKTFRVYDNKAGEDFIVNYLTNGTEEEIKERKKLFKTLPESLRETKKETAKEVVKEEVVEEAVVTETVTPQEPVKETPRVENKPKKRGRKAK